MKTKKITLGLVVTFILYAGICHAELRVLFTSHHNDSNYELYSMATNGTDITQISFTSAIDEWAPAISPNEIDVAFVNISGTASNIYLTSVFGDSPVQLNNNNEALCVQYASTNTIYFLAKTGPSGGTTDFQLWKINTDGSGEQRVYSDDFKCWTLGAMDFSINQANQNVYISSFTSSFSSSYIQYGGIADNEIQGTLIYNSSLGDRYAPDLSPNASKIAFCADHSGGNHRLYSDDAVPGGTPATQICDTFCGNPSWIDNNSIVFTRAGASTWGITSYTGDIWRVNFDGGELTKLTSIGSCAYPSVYDAIPEPYYLSFIIWNLFFINRKFIL